MPEELAKKSVIVYYAKNAKAEISEIKDGIYRMSGFASDFDITFNQFLIDDGQPMLIIHTGPVGNTAR